MKNSCRLLALIGGLIAATSFPRPASGADAALAVAVKLQLFSQTQPVGPVLGTEEEDPLGVQFFVDLEAMNSVTNASVQIPGGAVVALELQPFDDRVMEFEDFFEFKPDLDHAYSNSVYTFTIQTQNDGTRVVPVEFPPADAYPNPPRVSNFAAAQAIDASGDFLLTWDAFTGGAATDFIQVTVEDTETFDLVFESPGPGEPDSLTGLSNSVVIPSGTLMPGREYQVELLFARIVDFDDTTYPGVPVIAAFVANTDFSIRTVPVSDMTPPELGRASPSNFQGTPTGKAVVLFEFSEPMNTVLSVTNSIEWSGNVTGTSFVYTWDTTGTRLFANYPPGLPLNSTVMWELNPIGSPMNLRDAAGNLLPQRNGSLNVGSDSGAGDPDLEFFDLLKARLYRQTNNTPEPLDRHFLFLATDLLTYNGVTNGVIEVPNGRQAIPFLEGDIYDFEAEYVTQAQLDSFFPDGSYQVRFDTVNDGTRTFTFNLSGIAYPNPPTVTNYTAAQAIEPADPFVLGWDAFTGGTAGDFVSVEIYSADTDQEFEIFYTPGVGEPGALDGTSTSVTIPAYRLAPGRVYEALVVFVKSAGTDTTTYPGVIGAAGFATATLVELRTTGDQIQPSLTLVKMPDDSLQLTVTGERDRDYTIDSRFSLFDMWQPLQTLRVNGPEDSFTGSTSFIIPNAFQVQSRFFQAREGF